MNASRALITGASTGIGATYADRLARRGHDLILVARDRTRLESLAVRLRSETGVAVDVVQADLLDADGLARVERRLREDASIAMLVNNAGMAGGGPVASADPGSLDAIVRLNVLALTRVAAAAAPGFVARRAGTIINLSSVTALMTEGMGAVYPATKAYVLMFSEALATELAPHGVRVQAVLPGMTRTEIWERSGIDAATLPQDRVMEVGDMVDAALAGLDQGETVTIPSLPDAADWAAYGQARTRLLPNLSHRRPAARYTAAR